MSSKNQLQEWTMREMKMLPKYETKRVSGDDHEPVFCSVVIIGTSRYEGEPARSKKQAEKNAAFIALSWINMPRAYRHGA